MAIDTGFPMIKGHFIHGSGSQTVHHNRALTQYDGVWPVTTLMQSDVALTITAEDANTFYVNCTGNWKGYIIFQQPREA